ncbi:MAG: hypothetical protein QW503_06525 [Sulfolobales archaeon]
MKFTIKHYAITCLLIIQIFAFLKNVDGQVLATVLMLIAGLAGYELGRRR